MLWLTGCWAICVLCRVVLCCAVLSCVNQLNRYVSVAVDIEDATGRQRTFSASNHQTLARMGEDTCSLPLQLAADWNKASSQHSLSL